MIPTETSPVLAAAARNNADWCAAVCHSHGVPSRFGDAAWSSARRTPPYYPDAVTLHPGAVPADVLAAVDTATPDCSIKDSFATLDLAPEGFVELFTAQWIHRPADVAAGTTAPPLRAEPVTTAAELRTWQSAWHGDESGPEVFRPALLDHPSVRVLGLYRGAGLCGGAVLNLGAGVVGLSNLFAVDPEDAGAVWAATIAAAARHFPGRPLVGYEHGDALVPALASGFDVLGQLRVWLHSS
ncbi:hypothetical protein AAHZ94_04440 [Streptomyces sp. HSW2009]|uniref:hypothetical protein n=1 Tax=Streptomyces sp. HSW2009 TaxID=3142890 RepID=UPI0032EE403B